MSTDYLGVEFVPEQMAYRVELSLPNGGHYEDYFGDDESAALVRELVILTQGLEASRNFEGYEPPSICRRLRALLVERDLWGLPESLDWLQRVGITRARFEQLASNADVGSSE